MRTPRSIELDSRYSDPAARPLPWSEVVRTVRDAELYWISTVRADGRPHVTPLVGVLVDEIAHFCTGPEEQKARNLHGNDRVALTTGSNSWADGLDVVIEGVARRVEDEPGLRAAARAYAEKYDGAWRFEVGEGTLLHPGGSGRVTLFRIDPDHEQYKVLAFAKRPHGVTRYRFS